MTRALVFLSQNPMPPRSGFHRRGLEMLSALRELGTTTLLASSEMSADRAGQSWMTDSASTLRAQYVADVRLHQPSRTDRRIVRVVEDGYQRLKRMPPPWSRIHAPQGMRRWFSRLIEEWSPDVVLMNHVLWDRLIDHRRFESVCRAIDIHDLVTVNQRMWQMLAAALPPAPVDPHTTPDDVTKLDFFSERSLKADPEEFRILDRYDYTISITRQEQDTIQAATVRTKVLHVPMTDNPQHVNNTYSGLPVFVTGPNPFNVQGYLFFIKNVLPVIRRLCPDFRLQVTGHCSSAVRPVDGVVHSGFVADLRDVYQGACFAICPVFGLTGQQVKIVEAMAHGVPVVALERPAERSPMCHGLNGLVAHDAAEFAEHAMRLWRDRPLCRRLGEAARETIARELSPGRLVEALSPIVSREARMYA